MNLTGRPIYQKGIETKPKKRKPMRKVSRARQAYLASQEGLEDAAWMEKVKELPCAACRRPGPSDAHHCIHGRYGSRKKSARATIPLCKWCHQWGPDAIHNGKETWAAKHGPDYGFLPWVRAQIEGPHEIDF